MHDKSNKRLQSKYERNKSPHLTYFVSTFSVHVKKALLVSFVCILTVGVSSAPIHFRCLDAILGHIQLLISSFRHTFPIITLNEEIIGQNKLIHVQE